jgi:methyl-accepting chemotaxis protein
MYSRFQYPVTDAYETADRLASTLASDAQAISEFLTRVTPSWSNPGRVCLPDSLEAASQNVADAALLLRNALEQIDAELERVCAEIEEMEADGSAYPQGAPKRRVA